MEVPENRENVEAKNDLRTGFRKCRKDKNHEKSKSTIVLHKILHFSTFSTFSTFFYILRILDNTETYFWAILVLEAPEHKENVEKCRSPKCRNIFKK